MPHELPLSILCFDVSLISSSRALEYVMQQQHDEEALSVAVTLAAIYLSACDTAPTPFA
jgi:hypothetical protein